MKSSVISSQCVKSFEMSAHTADSQAADAASIALRSLSASLQQLAGCSGFAAVIRTRLTFFLANLTCKMCLSCEAGSQQHWMSGLLIRVLCLGGGDWSVATVLRWLASQCSYRH